MQAKSERDCETAGVRRGDQLLWVRALLIFEARPEGIGWLFECTGIGLQITVAGASSTSPDCFRFANHSETPTCVSLVKKHLHLNAVPLMGSQPGGTAL